MLYRQRSKKILPIRETASNRSGTTAPNKDPEGTIINMLK